MNYDNRDNYGHYESTANRIAGGILIIIISLLATLSLLNALGGVGKMISSVLLGVFGFVSYAYSVCGIIVGAAVTFGKRPTLSFDRAVKYILLFILGVVIFHVWFTRGILENASYGRYLSLSYKNGTPGGWLCSLFCFPAMKLSVTFFLVVLTVLFAATALASFYPLLKRANPYKAKSTKIKPNKNKKPDLTDFSREVPDENVYPTETGSGLFIGTVEENGTAAEFKTASKKQIKNNRKQQSFDALFPNRNSASKIEDSETEPVESDEERRRKSREKLFGDRKRKTEGNADGDSVVFGNYDDDIVPAHKSIRGERFRYNDEMKKSGEVRKPKSIREVFGIDNSEEGRIKDMRERIGHIINSEVKPSDVHGAPSKRIAHPKPRVETPVETAADEVKPVEEEKPVEVRKLEFDKPQPADGKDDVPYFIRNILENDGKKPSARREEKPAPAVSEIKPIPPMPPRPRIESILKKDNADAPTAAAETPRAQNEVTSEAVKDNGVKTETAATETPAELRNAYPVGDARNAAATVEPAGDMKDGDNDVGSIFSLFGRKKPSAKPLSDNGAANAPTRNETAGGVMPQRKFTSDDDRPALGDFSHGEPVASDDKKSVAVMPTDSEIDAVEREIKSRSADGGGYSAKDDYQIGGARNAAETVEKPSSYNNDFPIGDRARNVIITPNSEKQRTPRKPEQISIEQAIKERGLNAPYFAPPVDLLMNYDDSCEPEDYTDRITVLEETLSQFKVDAKVIGVAQGPTFSRFELRMPAGVSVNNVLKLDHDIAMKLRVEKIRFEAPIPGQDAFGIEVPNRKRMRVSLKGVIESEAFNRAKSVLTFALGKDIANEDHVCDLDNMPHLLIAGATGSGKSVCINSLIVSLLYRCGPNDLKLILVDPKQVELNLYSGLPHLLVPEVIDDPEIAINALDWLINEMHERFTLFKATQVRNITEYNDVAAKKNSGLNKIPRIVCIIDELADFILVKKKEIEDRIGKLTRLSRAAGIHLVVATQRPSVDIVTGTIKSNLPSRIAFSVTSAADSMTILGGGGAEKLLGKGDMLFAQQGKNQIRLQCTLVERDEVKAVVDYIKANNECFYDTAVEENIYSVKRDESDEENTEIAKTNRSDELFVDALRLCVMEGQASISRLQMKFSIGYPTAAKLIDEMEQKRYVSSNKGGNKRRDVLLTMEQFKEIYGSGDDE